MSEKRTGIIRRMDELGRIIVPRDLRDEVGFKPEQPFEIIVDEEKERVIFEHARLSDYISHKKKALFFTSDEFNNILKEVFGENVSATYELDGITISDGYDVLDTDVLNTGLAEHFGVDVVTSIHIDDCEEVGVWVIYK